MRSIDVLNQIAGENGGIITIPLAEKCNVSRAVLSFLCKNGRIERIAQGQYIVAEDIQDELFSISLRSNNIVFSHETALWLNGVSDRTPFKHTVTSPAGHAPSASIRKICRVRYAAPDKYNLGKTAIKTQFGNTVPCYDLERTICDCVRSRKSIGDETLFHALRQYALYPGKNLNLLHTYAAAFRIEKTVRRYLEVLL